MPNILTNRVTTLIEGILAELGAPEVDAARLIEIPPSPDLGDYAFPCFQLARILRKAPNAIAAEITERAGRRQTDQPWMDRVEAVGAYVNFFVDPGEAGREVVAMTLDEPDAMEGQKNGKTIVIDFSSPNIAKPFHVGHLRSTIIGHSLARIFAYLGYETVRLNFLGDWGTQFGKLIVAFKRWGRDLSLEQATIKDLLALYVRFHNEAESDPSLEDEARARFLALEEGSEEEVSLWRQFRELSLREFDRIYDRLGITFDAFIGESAYNTTMDRTVKTLEEKGLLEESEGAMVVYLDDLPPCLIKKKDGATLYATRDITAAIDRYESHGFEHLFYVVGAPQQLHFQQFFGVLRKMGYEWVDRLEHIPFGHIRIGDVQLSTRKGNVVYLSDLLDDAVKRALAIIDERNPGLAEKARVASQVGIGAIIFNDLSHNRIKDISFDWDTALNFEGDTGPYVQYTHARASSLLRKGGWSAEQGAAVGPDDLVEPETLALTKRVAAFDEAVQRAAEAREPSEIARYLISLCRDFNSFYHVHRILGSEREKARLALVAAVKKRIAAGLFLLGIEAPDEM